MPLLRAFLNFVRHLTSMLQLSISVRHTATCGEEIAVRFTELAELATVTDESYVVFKTETGDINEQAFLRGSGYYNTLPAGQKAVYHCKLPLFYRGDQQPISRCSGR